MSNFYTNSLTPETAWRLVILLGSNTRTYKFALGHSLLTHAADSDSVTLEELASTYSLELAKHFEFPQAPSIENLGEKDFLSVLGNHRDDVLNAGAATNLLVQAAMKSMPQMVMQKFHNVPQGFAFNFDFYEILGRSSSQRVIFTDEMQAVARSENIEVLSDELLARWNIVEASFDPVLGKDLRAFGVFAAPGEELLQARRAASEKREIRRPVISHLRHSISGFQGGVCFHCGAELATLLDTPHIDHVVARSLTEKGYLTGDFWKGLDLDQVWNLVVSCAPCNLAKSDSPPTRKNLSDLRVRNDLILRSPHPLKQSIRLVTGIPSNAFYSELVSKLEQFGAIR